MGFLEATLYATLERLDRVSRTTYRLITSSRNKGFFSMAKRSPRRQKYLDQQEEAQVVSLQKERMRRSRSKHQATDHRPTLNFLTEAQYQYAYTIDQNTLTFGLGPAGTGKSFVAAAKAAIMLSNNEIEKIIVTRPMVPGDEKEIGAIPGDVTEKFSPWFAPVRQILEQHLGKGAVDCHLKNGNIVVLPLQFMRGWTFSNCFVIVDECQNATKKQLELMLTRIGENCTMVINGDEDQTDLKGPNGLSDAAKRLKGVKRVASFRFTSKDIVRSELCRAIVERYHPVKHKIESSKED